MVAGVDPEVACRAALDGDNGADLAIGVPDDTYANHGVVDVLYGTVSSGLAGTEHKRSTVTAWARRPR